MEPKLSLINDVYSWDKLSLIQFLQEGNIPSGWSNFFANNMSVLTEISKLLDVENKERSTNRDKYIFPSINQVFRAFYLTPLDKVKVCILGMDPYHNGSAVGLCFSVKPNNNINPSLKNIYTELKNEGYKPVENGILIPWAQQGVLLLNKALTVSKGDPDSHTSIWYDFTDKVVSYIDSNVDGVIWLLMGKNAQEVEHLITNDTHNVLKTSHPSPYSASKSSGNSPAFLGSGVFKQINEILSLFEKEEIKW